MIDILIGIIVGVALGFSCIFPDTLYAVFLAFFAIMGMWFLFFKSRRYLFGFFFTGIAFHSTSMWWIASTIERFGGFNWFISSLLLIAYSLLSSLQFLFSAYLASVLDKGRKTAISFIFSWMIFELIFPRLFPWGLGNFFIHWKSFVSYAELFGERGLSLLILVITLLVYVLVYDLIKKRHKKFIFKFLIFIPILLVGYLGGVNLDNRAELVEKKADKVNALVVQGNLSIFEKGAQSYLEANIKTYQRLTRIGLKEHSDIDFVIWPETVMNRWTPVMYNAYPDISLDPFPELDLPLLYGTLAYFLENGKSREEALYYNGAILRDEDALISSYYAKRILMPFGEYVPFGSTFPFLNKLVPLGVGFSEGMILDPLLIQAGSSKFKAGILICYEDLISDISREYAKKDAKILINLTNDAWYGNSPAPYQHDLLARFRAIETRKMLIRSTNTGFTSLISSQGEILKGMPVFKESYEKFSFLLLDRETFFVEWGYLPLYLFLAVSGFYLIIGKLILFFKK